MGGLYVYLSDQSEQLLSLLTAAIEMCLAYVAGWLLWRILGHFVPRRPGWPARILGISLLTFASSIPIYIGDANILYILPFFLAAMLYVIAAPVLVRLTFACIFFCLTIEISAVYTALALPVDVITLPSHLLYRVVRSALIPPLILLLGAGLRRFRVITDTLSVLSPQLWRIAFLMGLFTFSMLLFCIAMPIFQPYWGDSPLQDAFDRYFILQNFMMTPFILLSTLVNLYVIRLLSRHEQLLQGQTLYEVNRAYYDQLEQSQLQIRRLRHDLTNHLQTMQQLEGDALHTYIASLVNAPAMQAQTRYCENQIVNAVLQNKMPCIEEAGIHADIAVSLPQPLPMQEIDLCALFANSLDNAIEACMALPHASRRLSVRARADKGLLMIRIRNRTADRSPLVPGCLPESTKADRSQHGLGLRSLKEITARYQGSLSLQRAHGMFELLVTIPLSQKP